MPVCRVAAACETIAAILTVAAGEVEVGKLAFGDSREPVIGSGAVWIDFCGSFQGSNCVVGAVEVRERDA